MRVRIRPLRAGAAALAVVAALLAPASAPASARAAAAAYVPISGAGSTWSSNALQAWAANVAANGMKVNYAETGSSDGRNQFRNGTVDFAVSEIPYGIAENGVVDPPPSRPYAYMPIVAGGTSFVYHLDSAGKRITNLRLSGQNLVKIFTGQLTMWNDPAIKAENPGIPLPARKIVPIVRQDGSGTTAQLTTWMASQYPAMWNSYCASLGRVANPCGTTSFYPVPAGSGFVQATGSTGVTGYVTQDTGEGAIGYVEYSYARNANFPVVKMLNAGGYYVEPTQWNVGVALRKAQIDPTTLVQKLDGVYTDSDPRTYPLSSYSYMIVPTSLQAPLNTQKGATLGDFAYYFLCEGQRHVGDLGYSPLPINLVQSGLDVVARIPGVNAQNINIANCNNPTFSTNGSNPFVTLAKNPPACAHSGPTQCADDNVTAIPAGAASGGAIGGTTGGTAPAGTTGGTAGGTTTGGATGGTTGGSTAGGTATGGSTAAAANGGATGAAATGGTTGDATGGAVGAATGTTGGSAGVDPDTGKSLTTGGTTAGGTAIGALPVANPQSIGIGISGIFQAVLMSVAALLLLVIAIGPPMLSRRLARRGRDGGGA